MSQPPRRSLAATTLVMGFGRLDAWLAKGERAVMVVALLTIVVIVFLQAILRYASGAWPIGEWLDPTRFTPPPEAVVSWFDRILLALRSGLATMYDFLVRGGGEVSRYALIWSAALGASVGMRDHRHIAVDLGVRVLEQRGSITASRWSQVIISLLTTAIVVYLAYCGFVLYQSAPIQTRQSAALGIPIRWVAFALPFGLGIMALRAAGGTVSRILELLGRIDLGVRYEGGGGLQALLAEYGAKGGATDAVATPKAEATS